MTASDETKQLYTQFCDDLLEWIRARCNSMPFSRYSGLCYNLDFWFDYNDIEMVKKIEIRRYQNKLFKGESYPFGGRSQYYLERSEGTTFSNAARFNHIIAHSSQGNQS